MEVQKSFKWTALNLQGSEFISEFSELFNWRQFESSMPALQIYFLILFKFCGLKERAPMAKQP